MPLLGRVGRTDTVAGWALTTPAMVLIGIFAFAAICFRI